MSISVAIATYNEESNIERCLESVKNIADEIIIADEESTDNTVKIAKKYGSKIISVKHSNNFHITKNIAIDTCTKNWILNLDADEVVSPELAKELIDITNDKFSQDDNVGYWMNRKNWFLTKFLEKGGQFPDPTLRFYKKGYGRLPAKDVHEQAVVNGKVGNLKSPLLHYRDTSFDKYISGFNRYSSFISNQLQESGLQVNIVNTVYYIFFKPLITFIKIFIRHRGYVDGTPGFIFALYSGWIHSVAYIKLWQRKLI